MVRFRPLEVRPTNTTSAIGSVTHDDPAIVIEIAIRPRLRSNAHFRADDAGASFWKLERSPFFAMHFLLPPRDYFSPIFLSVVFFPNLRAASSCMRLDSCIWTGTRRDRSSATTRFSPIPTILWTLSHGKSRGAFVIASSKEHGGMNCPGKAPSNLVLGTTHTLTLLGANGSQNEISPLVRG